MPQPTLQTVKIYTGDIESIRTAIQEHIDNNPTDMLTRTDLMIARGLVPGYGLACLCVWTKQ